MAEPSSNSGRGKNVAAEENNNEAENEMATEEMQLQFILNVGIVKDCELSMPYRTQLTGDKWNLFLRVDEFEDILLGFLKEGEDVKEGIEVNAYDRGGHEFEMMLRKCEMGTEVFYVLNRGWLAFWDQHRLGENDFVALRTFRHAFTDKLSFAVTYTKMN